MPMLKEITDDIKLILSKNQQSDDFRAHDRNIDFKVHQYRATEIRSVFKRERQVNPTWLQDQGNLVPTKVTSDDDPAIAGCKGTFGKIDIPTVVNLPNFMGVYRVASACKTKSYYRTTLQRFMGFVPDSTRANQNYFFVIGHSVYMSPYIQDASVQLILENPLQGTLTISTNIPSGELEVGTVYQVSAGDITHDSVKYRKGATFTAVNANFTGSGSVQLQDQKRLLRRTDDYPMDLTMLERVKLKILTQDYAIEERKIADLDNDSVDETAQRDQG